MDPKILLLIGLIIILSYRKRQWLLGTLRRRRPLLIRLSIAFFVLAAFHAGLKVMLAHQPPCQPPCRPLRIKPGSEQVDQYGSKTYAPQAEPFDISLELDKPETRVGTYHTLDYRVILKNISDANFDIHASFFERIEAMDPSYMNKQGVFFWVWDPQGKVVQIDPAPRFGDDPTKSTSDIIPYDLDPVSRGNLSKREDKYGLVALKPGGSITSVPSILWPHRMVLKDFITKDAIETVEVPEPVLDPKNLGFSAPTPGFQVLDYYNFKSPGEYRIQVVLEYTMTAVPSYPIFERLPYKLQLFLRRIQASPDDRMEKYRLHSESKTLKFRVIR